MELSNTFPLQVFRVSGGICRPEGTVPVSKPWAASRLVSVPKVTRDYFPGYPYNFTELVSGINREGYLPERESNSELLRTGAVGVSQTVKQIISNSFFFKELIDNRTATFLAQRGDHFCENDGYHELYFKLFHQLGDARSFLPRGLYLLEGEEPFGIPQRSERAAKFNLVEAISLHWNFANYFFVNASSLPLASTVRPCLLS
jgi:hypothetical protein